MNNYERKILNKQYHYTLIFKDNTYTSWVVDIADKIADYINTALKYNLHGSKLMDIESHIQDLCDIFEEPNHKYESKDNYNLCLAKYGSNKMPFNYLWRVHDITGLGLGLN